MSRKKVKFYFQSEQKLKVSSQRQLLSPPTLGPLYWLLYCPLHQDDTLNSCSVNIWRTGLQQPYEDADGLGLVIVSPLISFSLQDGRELSGWKKVVTI